jgi:hypothetical protein
VDLSFDRAGLGSGGESNPLNATSGKRRKQAKLSDRRRHSYCLL